MELESSSSREQQQWQGQNYYAERHQDNGQHNGNSNLNGVQETYFNSNFANLDAIYGFEQNGRSGSGQNGHGLGQQNYQNQNGRSGGRNATGYCQQNGSGGRIEMGADGVLNVKLPVAYTYQYTKEKEDCGGGDDGKKKTKSRSKSCPRSPLQRKSDPCGPCGPPAFCSTVRNLCGPPRQGYIAKCLSQPIELPGSGAQGRNKTSRQIDYGAGTAVLTKKIDYGQELYETAACNFAQHLQIQKCYEEQLRKRSGGTSTTDLGEEKGSKCKDLSKPAYNSSLKTAVDLAEALQRLQNLPNEIETMFKGDKRFEPEIMNKATKALNIPRSSKVFRDLVSINGDCNLKEQVTKALMEQVQSVKPLARSRDPEPNILDYQEISFSRIKPKPISPPGKPTSGVSVNVLHDFHMADRESEFLDQADTI